MNDRFYRIGLGHEITRYTKPERLFLAEIYAIQELTQNLEKNDDNVRDVRDILTIIDTIKANERSRLQDLSIEVIKTAGINAKCTVCKWPITESVSDLCWHFYDIASQYDDELNHNKVLGNLQYIKTNYELDLESFLKKSKGSCEINKEKINEIIVLMEKSNIFNINKLIELYKNI